LKQGAIRREKGRYLAGKKERGTGPKNRRKGRASLRIA